MICYEFILLIDRVHFVLNISNYALNKLFSVIDLADNTLFNTIQSEIIILPPDHELDIHIRLAVLYQILRKFPAINDGTRTDPAAVFVDLHDIVISSLL